MDCSISKSMVIDKRGDSMSITKVDKKNKFVLEFLDLASSKEEAEFDRRCGEQPTEELLSCPYQNFGYTSFSGQPIYSDKDTTENYENEACSCPMLHYNGDYCDYVLIQGGDGYCEMLVSVKVTA